jgi:hypothetical protein
MYIIQNNNNKIQLRCWTRWCPKCVQQHPQNWKKKKYNENL